MAAVRRRWAALEPASTRRCAAVAAFVALLAGAGVTHAAGINLSWDDCGVAGDELETFACSTITATPVALVGSFVPPAGVDQLVGFSAEIRIEAFALPDWWHTSPCGGGGVLTTDLDFRSGPGTCLDPWSGQASGSFTYQVRYYGPNTVRLGVSGFVPEARAIVTNPSSEYYAFKVLINQPYSIIAGFACSGCEIPVRLTLQEILLFQRVSAGYDPLLTEAVTRNTVRWQGEPGPPPEVLSFDPTSGRPGDEITIRGRYFTGANHVQFGTALASFTVVSDSMIVAVVPSNAATGQIWVGTIRGAGRSVDEFRVAPTIRYFIPRQAPVSHWIAITGNGFTTSASVTIDGHAAEVGFRADTLVQAKVPAGAVAGPIVVSVDGVADTSDAIFTVGPWFEGRLELAWNDCSGGGSDLETFACNTNNGSSSLIGSFIPPPDVIQLVGFEADVRITAGALPNWWKHGLGQCRGPSALDSDFDFRSGPFTCRDLWAGNGSGSHNYQVGYYGPNTARLRLTAFGPERPVSSDSQYYAFRLNVGRTRTVGNPSCSGCGVPVSLSLQHIQLFQDQNVWFNPPAITTPVRRNTVFWQGAPGPPPLIYSFVPSFGTPGTSVTVRGAGFTDAFSVRFDLAPATFIVVSDSIISTTVPDSALAGPIHVSTTRGATSSAQDFIQPPRIIQFTPHQGLAGRTVTVTGENLLGMTQVEFNGLPASFAVYSRNLMTTTVPAGATDGPIVVTNPAGSDTSDVGFIIAPIGPGGTINLSWDDCGLSGTVLKTFACDANTGTPFTFVGSFVPSSTLPEFLGVSVDMVIRWDTSNVPDWWRHGSGLCRGNTGLATNFDFTSGPFSCLDFYVGFGAGGHAYDLGYGSPNQARLRIQAAVPFENRGVIDPSSEYYAFKVSLLRGKTTGSGSCNGCFEPACIVLNEIQLFQTPELANDPRITNSGARNFVNWQQELPSCPGAVPTLVSVVTAEARFDRILLVWQTEDIERATVHRREAEGEWRQIASLYPDGQGRVTYEDTDVTPGATYDYRLGVPVPTGEVYMGETHIAVPSAAPDPLALARVAWDASAGALAVSLSLPKAGLASFELFDVNGRRLGEERLEGLEAGRHELSLRPAQPLMPGVFFARVTQNGEAASRRFVVFQ